jgi:hypothetical protein
MRRGDSKAQSGDRGGTSWNDGLHSLDGAGLSNGSISTSESIDAGIGGASGNGTDFIGKTSWFAPVDTVLTEDFISDCPGGICPVPWATKEETPAFQGDVVNHPSHYTDGGGIECIEAIEAQLTPEEYQGYLRGNCVKYLWRWRHKGGKTDLLKAQWYLDRLLLVEEQK